jgi:hypothetical protein
MANKASRYIEIRDESEDYEQTVRTILAFSALVCHDGRSMRPDSHFGIGRRMSSSDTSELTPDIVIQRSATYGVVAEVKKSMPLDQAHWHKPLEQLRSYDTKLQGWWTATGKMPVSDACVLIHQSRSRAFIRFLEGAKDGDPSAVGGASSVVEFNRSDEANAYVFFRLEWGPLRDSGLQESLKNGKQIPLAGVLRSFPAIKFYDARPPIEWIMKELWIDFAGRVNQAKADPTSGVIRLDVSASELTLELQRAYGSEAMERDARSAVFPREVWVKEALLTLKAIGLAEAGPSEDTFVVLFRPFPSGSDALERFVKMVDQRSEKLKLATTQLTLPIQPASRSTTPVLAPKPGKKLGEKSAGKKAKTATKPTEAKALKKKTTT